MSILYRNQGETDQENNKCSDISLWRSQKNPLIRNCNILDNTNNCSGSNHSYGYLTSMKSRDTDKQLSSDIPIDLGYPTKYTCNHYGNDFEVNESIEEIGGISSACINDIINPCSPQIISSHSNTSNFAVKPLSDDYMHFPRTSYNLPLNYRIPETPQIFEQKRPTHSAQNPVSIAPLTFHNLTPFTIECNRYMINTGLEFPVLQTRIKPRMSTLYRASKSNLSRTQSRNQCNICGKFFPSTSNLTSHLRCHLLKEDQIPCKICGSSFKRNHDLERHIETHHFKLRITCGGVKNGQNWGCRMSYSRKDALVKHWNGKGEICLNEFRNIMQHKYIRRLSMKELRKEAFESIYEYSR